MLVEKHLGKQVVRHMCVSNLRSNNQTREPVTRLHEKLFVLCAINTVCRAGASDCWRTAAHVVVKIIEDPI
jgi:hypothetical protein